MSIRGAFVWRIILLLILLGALMLLFVWSRDDAGVPDLKSPTSQSVSSKSVVAANMSLNASAVVVAKQTISPIITPLDGWKAKIKVVGNFDLEDKILSPSEVAGQFKNIASKAAAGDPLAAVALYRFTQYCAATVVVTDECRIERSAVESNPFYWLLLDANSSNPQVAITLFGAVRDLALYGQPSSQTESLKSSSLKALESSVESGAGEVFILLSAAYSDGTVVARDPIKSFVYMDMYAKATADAASIKLARQLNENLRAADKLAAADLANDVVLKLQK